MKRTIMGKFKIILCVLDFWTKPKKLHPNS